jgi:IS30 family transposase
MPGAPLSLPEREEISVVLITDPTIAWAALARLVDRHPTTVMREVRRNGGRDRYRPAVAQQVCDTSRLRAEGVRWSV